MTKQFSLSALHKAFCWWKEGLLACLPDNFQGKPRQKPTLQCTMDGDSFTLIALDESGLQLNSLSLDLNSETSNDSLLRWLKPYQHHNVILVLSDTQYLLKPLSLPAQAKDNIDKMIQFEVDRQTPFSADQVHIGYQINKDPEAKDISLILAVVPKQLIANLVERLASASFKINTLLINGGANSIEIVLSESRDHSPSYSYLNYWLAGLVVILTTVFLYRPILYYDNKMDALQTPLASVKKQAQSANELKAGNAEIIQYSQFLDNKMRGYRSRLVLLEKLADVLPQHTWLEQSTIRDTVLTIQGESDSASDLIALLTESSYLSEVQFGAPTTFNDRSNKDRFKIQALIEAQN